MNSSGSTKALAGQGELSRQVEELQQKLDEEIKVRGRWAEGLQGVNLGLGGTGLALLSGRTSPLVCYEMRNRADTLVPARTIGGPPEALWAAAVTGGPATSVEVAWGSSHSDAAI